MTELDLYKFVQDKEIDWRGDHLILWLYPSEITDFAELLGEDALCEGGIEVALLAHGIIALDIVQLCEDYGIDAERIHPKDESA